MLTQMLLMLLAKGNYKKILYGSKFQRQKRLGNDG